MSRRISRKSLLALAAALLASPLLAPEAFAAPNDPDAVRLSDAAWRKRLTPPQYDILRRHGTEAPWSSPLEGERRPGIYRCAGCELALFSSKTKYDSGTGWPSFFAPLPHAIETSIDHELVYPRTEVHCRRCEGHLGHVFDDGPPPTHLRYCMNGAVLKFAPRG